MRMNEKPPIKLFSWKRAVIPLVIGVAVVSYRTYESYQKKGRLDSVDVWAAVIPILLLFGILGAAAWWANRRD
jgi:hypothetical protein